MSEEEVEVEQEDAGIVMKRRADKALAEVVVNAKNIELHLANVAAARTPQQKRVAMTYSNLAMKTFELSHGALMVELNEFKKTTKEYYTETIKPFQPEKKPVKKKTDTKEKVQDKDKNKKDKSRSRSASPVRKKTPPPSPPRQEPKKLVQQTLAFVAPPEQAPTTQVPQELQLPATPDPTEPMVRSPHSHMLAQQEQHEHDMDMASTQEAPATPTYE